MSLAATFPALLAVFACGVAAYLCPRLIQAALKYGIVDRPSTDLKTHREPVPYLGGIAVFLAFLLALAIGFPFHERVLAILLCASLVVAVGLIDDLGTLTPRDKLLGQLVAAFVLVKAGVEIELEAWPSPLDEGLTILWMVTCMNAFNIVDVSDGLAATAAIVGAGAVAVVAALHGDAMLLTFAAALAGACVGFLWFNRPPARMYLGDTGSMLLGVLLGAMIMLTRYSEANDVAPFFAPLALLAIPLFDLVLVVLARLAARRPVYHGSPDHFAVRMKDHGFSARAVVVTAGIGGVFFAAVGIAATFAPLGLALVFIGAGVAAGLLLLAWVFWRFPARSSPRFSEAVASDKRLPRAGAPREEPEAG